MNEVEEAKKIAVIGGGLVGVLNACFLAQRGFIVHIYERRQDIRAMEHVAGRSINLALSKRGRDALKAVNLESLVVENGIPMKARMIHPVNGQCYAIPYGKKDEHLMAIDRRLLNEILLNQAEKYPNVTLHFEHKLVSCDFETGGVTFKLPSGSQHSDTYDLVVGNDGAYSNVRGEMLKYARINFSQHFIDHGYIELRFPPTGDDFCMPTNYLHIWPRNEFMLIGLPNTDKSFTGTLFMPFKIFENIKTPEQVDQFFADTFPDSIPLIGREELKTAFMKTRPQTLISIKTDPYHVGSKFVIMGDAAHAMVPFYGQGMNCGFEDCLLFDELMTRYNNDFTCVLEEFSKIRPKDAHTICELALYNYIEMRKSVNSSLFLLRKSLDNFIHWLFPNTWVPLYTMVSFTRTPYSTCIRNRQWQDKMITWSLGVTGIFSATSIIAALYAIRR